jgi:hypothetical protein
MNNKLKSIVFVNWIVSNYFLWITEASQKLYISSDFQSIIKVVVGQTNIFDIGFYPLNSLLILSPFILLIHSPYYFSILFIVLITTLFHLTSYMYLSSRLLNDGNLKFVYLCVFCFSMTDMWAATSVHFLIEKGSVALLFSLSLVPLFLYLQLNRQFTLPTFLWLAYVIFLFHPIAFTLFLIILFFEKPHLAYREITNFQYISFACVIVFFGFVTHPILFSIYRESFSQSLGNLNFSNYEALARVIIEIHSHNIVFSLLIIILKLLTVVLIPSKPFKYFLFFFMFIFPFLTFLTPYDNIFSIFFRLLTFPLNSNVYYLNAVYLYLPFMLLRKFSGSYLVK